MSLSLSQIIDQYSLEIYIADADTLQYLYVNPAAEKNTGYSLAELRRHTMELLAPHTNLAFLKEMLSPLRNDPNVAELKLSNINTRRDGSRYPIDIVVKLIEYEGRPAFAGIIQDATEKQLLLDQLHYVLKGSSLGYFDWDLEKDTFFVNDRWYEMLGYAPGEVKITPNNVGDFISDHDRGPLEKNLQDFMFYDDNFSVEFRGKHKNGSLVWIHSSGSVVARDVKTGRPIRICGTHEDITRQKQDEQEKEQFYKFFQMSSDLMMIGRLDDGSLLKANPASMECLGYEEDELLAMLLIDMVHPDDREATLREHQKQISSGETLDFENRLLRKDGSTLWISWRATFNKAEGLSYATGRDITQQKQTEEELHKMQKLNSLGILAGGIAHDFNNILTALFGNIALAKSRLPAEHKSRGSLEQAEKAFHRATHLTSQLLTFAKGGDPLRQDISISSFIEEVVSFDLSGSNVRLVFKAPADLWNAYVDKGQIGQVFSNLTINANQAMPRGGHLYVTIENAVVKSSPHLPLEAGHYLKFKVRDEGIGIDSKDLDKIFDPYFTTKQQGSGLGLATVYSIVQKHGGHIAVESTPGKGTSFTLYLPASIVSVAVERSEDAVMNETKKTSGRILIMDDEEMICDLSSTFLSGQGYSVDTAKNGEEAIQLCRRALEEDRAYDCMVMDLTIPGGMSGKDALAEILKLQPDARAIVSSGYASDPVMANFDQYGFKGCITKPFFINKLHEEIKRVMNQG